MTEQEKRSCGKAFKARYVRCDGHFFVGAYGSSLKTGIEGPAHIFLSPEAVPGLDAPVHRWNS